MSAMTVTSDTDTKLAELMSMGTLHAGEGWAIKGHEAGCICLACCELDGGIHTLKTLGLAKYLKLEHEFGGNAYKVESVRTRFAKPGQRAGRGIVRKISPKQARYLAHLLRTREFSSLIGKPWFTMDVENISLAGARTFIDALLGCPERPADELPADLLTERQASFIIMLMRQSEITGTVFEGKTEDDVKRLTRAGASKAIEMLKALPKAKALTAPVATTKEEVRELGGLWQMTDGTIYRMRKARGKAHFYAELLTDAETGAFEYAAGMARRVPSEGRKMTLEECAALSELMGACCMCGRELTATVNGVGPAGRYIGPICEAKITG